MPVSLKDKQATKEAMRQVIAEAGKEEITAAVHDAVRIANQALRAAGQNPPEGATLDEWSVEAIADSVEVYWDPGEPEGKLEQGDALIAEWTHPHADKINVGVRPHEIEGNPVLIFEWPNMPDEVAEQFRSQWESPNSFLEEPQVAYAKVSHPGIPGVGFIQKGFREALRKHFG